MAWSIPVRDTIASSIINNLVEKASSLASDQLLWGKDFQDQLCNLKNELPKVEAVLIAAENKGLGLGNSALNKWMWQFRAALEAADDLLDEITYNEMDQKVQSEDSMVSSNVVSTFFSGCKRKFDDFFGISSSMRKDTAHRLKHVVNELNNLVGDVGNFLQLAIPSGKEMREKQENFEKNHEAGGLNVENQVFGRVNERQQVISWLVKQETESRDSSTSNIYAFTIIGLGGMGKTTLARLIYNDQNLKTQFDLILWVCVSNRFDVVKITKDILQAINKEQYLPQSLNALQETLKDKLLSKKFLLILDDVWNGDNMLEWDKLMAPLKFGRKGSKILVTTRMNSVAEMIANVIERKKEILILEGIKREDCISLLNKHAFAGVNNLEEFKELQFIGVQIAEKLGGCPLAAKVLGGQLNRNKEEYFWNKILKEHITVNADESRESENAVKEILRLSYLSLSVNLQRCFRFCSIFPQDYVFERDELIYMWIGSGLIQKEDTGRDYINHLVRNSFFDIKESNLSNSNYVLHDLLHDLAKSVSLEECSSFGGNESQHENLLSDIKFPETIRHLYAYVCEKNDRKIFDKITGLKKLRTLIVVFKGNDTENNHVGFLDEIVKELKCLRLLSFTASFSFRFPNSIDGLIHLRYLTLKQTNNHGSSIDWFPESVYKLYHLKVMRLLGETNGNYDRINVNRMTNLVELRRLEIPKQILSRIPFISKLESLQGSMVFHVKNENGYKIHELKRISGINDLCITNLENVMNPQESRDINLFEKNKIKSLSLIWSKNPNRVSNNDENIINMLRPSLKLRELNIQGYNGTKSPYWIEYLSNFSSLRSISLISCNKWINLPSFGQLPLLKFLEIGNLHSVKEINHSFYGGDSPFPELKELRFYCMKNWDKWVGINDSSLVPHVNKLTIEKCPNLRALSRVPFTARRLVIKDVGFDSFPEIYSSETLEELEIKYCEKRIIIQPDWFMKQKSLKLLHIGKCPNFIIDINDIDNNRPLLPLTLDDLSIGSCGNLELLFLNSLINLTSLNKLSLEDCSNLTDLPSEQVFEKLANLSSLKIKKCDELISLGGLGVIPSLDSLTIIKCEKLILNSNSNRVNVRNLSFKIRFLNIDNQSLLSIEPLKRAIFVEVLKIDLVSDSLPEQFLLQNCDSLWEIDLYNASLLSSIPMSIKNISRLKRLNLCKASILVGSIVTFPTSLQSLHICGCDASLVNQYRSGMLFWNIFEERTVEINVVHCDYEPAFFKDFEFDQTDLPSEDVQINTLP